MYEKCGEYDNQMDVAHCKALLETLKKNQEDLANKTSSSNQNVNANPVKMYPLPFNAYNLDEENVSVH